MTGHKTAFAAMSLAVLALSALAGCNAQPLTMDVVASAETNSVTYHLDDSGKLTVTGGGGMVEAETGRKLHDAKLTDKEMAELKHMLFNNGFFFADRPPTVSLSTGPTITVEADMGMLHNTVSTPAGEVRSVDQIIEFLNRHVPKGLALPTVRAEKSTPPSVFGEKQE
jgi:hypothetical protein